MKTKHLLPALKALLVLTAYLPFLAATTGGPFGPAPDTSNRVDDFALDLLRSEAAVSNRAPANGLFSPFSIYSCMAMGYVASSGSTRYGLARALYFPADNDLLLRDLPALRRKIADEGNKPGVELRMAEAVWLDSTYAKWRPDYLRTLDRLGAQPPRDAKFADKTAACAEINRWISDTTHGRITSGITPADLPSRSNGNFIDEPALVAVDAVWFKAQWMHRFDAAETKQHSFNTPGGSVNAPMMHQNSLFLYAADPHWQLLVMPCVGGRFSMLALLPRDVEDAKTMTASLTPGTVPGLLTHAHPATVDILFPKFTLRNHADLEAPLTALGAGDAFNRRGGNFDGMIIQQPNAAHIYLSSLKHDTWLQVSEEGAEAAAATTATYFSVGCAARPEAEREEFHADRPFLFFIVHNPSRAVLFAGWVTDPSAGGL
ncbi:MAG TPA: serpin family protein [Chthoniobacteraceae bacterium]|nr:serpin family protein [Chthoniobacteraceae bacterium]